MPHLQQQNPKVSICDRHQLVHRLVAALSIEFFTVLCSIHVVECTIALQQFAGGIQDT